MRALRYWGSTYNVRIRYLVLDFVRIRDVDSKLKKIFEKYDVGEDKINYCNTLYKYTTITSSSIAVPDEEKL